MTLLTVTRSSFMHTVNEGLPPDYWKIATRPDPPEEALLPSWADLLTETHGARDASISVMQDERPQPHSTTLLAQILLFTRRSSDSQGVKTCELSPGFATCSSPAVGKEAPSLCLLPGASTTRDYISEDACQSQRAAGHS